MAKNILVATPQPAFGELLRLSLEETGRYRVRLVHSGREALAAADQVQIALAILDSGLSEPPAVFTALGLRERQADLRLILISTTDDGQTGDWDVIPPDETFLQPFDSQALLVSVDRLTQAGPAHSESSKTSSQHGPNQLVKDLQKITGQLEEFLLDSTALGALVIAGHQPWTAAGEISPQACQEICGLLARYIDANEGVDLARFVHLNSLGGAYLVYATPLCTGMTLVLVYHVTTPLTVIRAQAGRLSRALCQPPPHKAPLGQPSQTASEPLDEEESDDFALETENHRLVELLAEMPDPNPGVVEEKKPADWVQVTLTGTASNPEFLFPWEIEAARAASAATQAITARPKADQAQPSAAAIPQGPQPSPSTAATRATASSLAQTVPHLTSDEPALSVNAAGELLDPAETVSGGFLSTALSAPALNNPPPAPPLNGDTQPVVLRSLQSLNQVEPIIPALSNLAYTCVLVPRLPNHALVGPAAEQIMEWLPQLCLAYGWRLEGLIVRPEYLQWTVQVAPALSPGNVLRLIRQQTYRRLFNQFPQYEIQNPSGDFWAPGYLIISGFQPPSLNLVHDYIRQTRQRQGNGYH